MPDYIALLISFGTPLIIAIAVVLIVLGVKAAHRRFTRLLKMKLLVVRLPQKPEEKEKKDSLAEINFFTQLLGQFASLKKPFTLETAVHNVGEDIHFYIAVPEEAAEFAVRQIQGLWPDAQVHPADDYTIFNSGGVARLSYLKQKQHYALPVRTFAEAGLDTFLSILNNFSKLEVAGEGIALQVLAKPAPASVGKNISKIIYNLKRGQPLVDALAGKAYSASKPKKGESAPPVIIDEEALKLLNQKLSKPIFNVNIRLVASAMSAYRAEELLYGLNNSFSQFTAPGHNEFKISAVRNPQKDIFRFVFREFDSGQIMTLGADELASVWHLPTSGTEVPKIKWVKTREAPPPTLLPSIGTLIGESVFRGESRPVFITDEDRRRHLYVVGQTGTGKSTLLINMAAADMNAGKGLAVVDPHGELIDSILKLVPPERADDVIVFDPGDTGRPLGLNMLEHDPTKPEQKTFIVNEMQNIFNKLFTAETMGPMFEQYMRNALLLLMDDSREQATLMEVPMVFTDSEYRKRLLDKATNPTVIDFWTKEASKAGGEASLANMTPYITSKFNNFIANDYMRPIIGQPTSSLSFRKIMDEGKILLVNLSKGKIGDINMGLLGMVIIGKIVMAALSRIDTPQEKRRDFNLLVDEFQNFTTDATATILSEARKYRLSLVAAHQFIAQLPEKIRDAVFGNVGSMVIFRVGADDAKFLTKQFEPVFTENDLVNIDNFNILAKLLINGQTSRPFNARTLPSPAGNPALAVQIKEKSRQTYGRSRQEVEADILKRLRS